MNVRLPTDLEKELQEEVEGGFATSAADFIADAVRTRLSRVRALRAELDAIEAGDERFDAEDVFDELLARINQR